MMCMLMHAMHGQHDSHSAHDAGANTSHDSLLEILKRRFALGEIDEAQFEQMKHVLGLSAAPQADGTAEHAGHHSTS